MAEITQETVDRVQQKLQKFHDSLSEEEQTVLQSLLTQARQGAEVGGFMRQDMMRFRMMSPMMKAPIMRGLIVK